MMIELFIAWFLAVVVAAVIIALLEKVKMAKRKE